LTGGASAANAHRGKYIRYFEDLNSRSNAEFAFEGMLRGRFYILMKYLICVSASPSISLPRLMTPWPSKVVSSLRR